MHPPSTGSHIKTLFRVTEAMVARGHHVTTVRYEMIQGCNSIYIWYLLLRVGIRVDLWDNFRDVRRQY